MNYLKIKNEKIKAVTGKDWSLWFKILDKWDAEKKGHYLTAKYLASKYKLSPWWSQVVTIRYEKERGY